MTVIDAHTHILPPDLIAQREALGARDPYFGQLYGNPRTRLVDAECLVAALDRAGVQAAVTFGFAFADEGLCSACTDYVLDAAARHPGRLIPFALVNPACGASAARAAADAAARGALGIGELMPDGQGFCLDAEPRLEPLLEAARALNLPVMVHANEQLGHLYAGKGCQGPTEAYELARLHPDNTFVLSHWGGGLLFYELMPEVQIALRRVYYDTAATPYLYDPRIYRIAVELAPQRVLFGSDYPLLRPERALADAEGAGIAPEARAALLGSNARALLGL